MAATFASRHRTCLTPKGTTTAPRAPPMYPPATRSRGSWGAGLDSAESCCAAKNTEAPPIRRSLRMPSSFRWCPAPGRGVLQRESCPPRPVAKPPRCVTTNLQEARDGCLTGQSSANREAAQSEQALDTWDGRTSNSKGKLRMLPPAATAKTSSTCPSPGAPHPLEIAPRAIPTPPTAPTTNKPKHPHALRAIFP